AVAPEKTGGKMELTGKAALLQQKAVAAATAVEVVSASASYVRWPLGLLRLQRQELRLEHSPVQQPVPWRPLARQQQSEPQPVQELAQPQALRRAALAHSARWSSG